MDAEAYSVMSFSPIEIRSCMARCTNTPGSNAQEIINDVKAS